MMFSLIGILFLIIPLAYLLASVVGLSYLWYRVLKGKRGGDLPTCARCGYGVRGLAGLNCPECGADLREVGITTPTQRGAISPILFVLLWTLLLPGPTCLVSGIIVAIGPKQQVSMGDMLSLSSPNSGEYQLVSINRFTGAGPVVVNQGSTMMASLSVNGNNQQYENMSIDPGAMTYEDYTNYTYTAQNPTPPIKTLDRQALLDMLKRVGADPTHQDVIDEADDLFRIIQAIQTRGLSNVSSSHFSTNYTAHTYDQPAVWFVLLMLGLCVAFWIAGLVYFFRVRRKFVPQASPFKAEPARFAPPSDSGPPAPPSF